MVNKLDAKELHFGHPNAPRLCYAVLISVFSWRLCEASRGMAVLIEFLSSLCIFATLRLCVKSFVLHLRLLRYLQQFGGLLPSIRCGGTPPCTAAVTREQSAAHVSFQRRSPSHPPPQNVNSAALREHPACHFGGLSAQTATLIAS